MTATTTLAGLTIKLEPTKRIELANRLIDLCTAAMLLQHDRAARLAQLSVLPFLHSSKTDRVLLAGVASLTAFVRDRAEDGITLPEWHPCYLPSLLVEEGE